MSAQTDGRRVAPATAVPEIAAAQAAPSAPSVAPSADSALSVPQLPPGCDVLSAALAYAGAGWFVGPLARGTKHPGSVLGAGWPGLTSRGPEQLAAWFAGTDHGVFLHVGRSGAVVLDVDHPGAVPELLREHLPAAPFQSTRPDEPGRGHFVFAVPPGRRLGNGAGTLGRAWGDVRGVNGVVVAAPSEDRYRWLRTGPVPLLPAALDAALPDAAETAEAATDAEVVRFAAEHTAATRPGALAAVLRRFTTDAATGSRHEAARDAACWAAREAAAGLYPAATAAEQLREAFVALMAAGHDGARTLSATAARAEFAGLWSWAVAQARGADVAAVRTEATERLERPTSGYSLGMAPVVPEQRPAALEAANASPAEVGRRHLRERALSLSALAGLPPVEPLIDGLLYRNTLAQLSGAPGEYKTFLSLGMALSVALGRSFEGHRVPQAGPVVYVAAEGSTGLLARVMAWCHLSGVDPAALDGRFYVVPEPVHLGSAVDVAEAVEFAAEIGAALLVLDTRARCTLGLEENSATEQGQAIHAAERIQRASGATVLVVHHAGRSGEHGRGSTAWDGAVWSDLRVSGADLRATIQCAKHKDVPDGCKHDFDLKAVTVPAHLMSGASQASRTTLVAVQGALWTLPLADGKNARIVQKIVWTAAPAEGLPPGVLRDLAVEQGASRSGAYGAINALVTSGFLRNVGSGKAPRYVTDTQAPTGEAGAS